MTENTKPSPDTKEARYLQRLVRPVSVVRAFRVDVTGCADASFIVRTISQARAKYLVWKLARDAGYDNLSFGRCRVKRASAYDHTVSLHTGKCYGLDYAESLFDGPNK